MPDNKTFKSDIDNANQHANDLTANTEFKAIHDFTYASSPATKQIGEVLNQLDTVVKSFSELTLQNSNDIKKIAKAHEDSDILQAEKWRNEQ